MAIIGTRRVSAYGCQVADEVEACLLEVLGAETLPLDESGQPGGLPIERVTVVLVRMELKGLVRPLGGMDYAAVDEEQGNHTG